MPTLGASTKIQAPDSFGPTHAPVNFSSERTLTSLKITIYIRTDQAPQTLTLWPRTSALVRSVTKVFHRPI